MLESKKLTCELINFFFPCLMHTPHDTKITREVCITHYIQFASTKRACEHFRKIMTNNNKKQQQQFPWCGCSKQGLPLYSKLEALTRQQQVLAYISALAYTQCWKVIKICNNFYRSRYIFRRHISLHFSNELISSKFEVARGWTNASLSSLW